MARAILSKKNSDTERVEFDVVYDEEPQFRNRVTEKPVESGVDIVDHAEPLPYTFRLTGIVTGDEHGHDDAAEKLRQLKAFRNHREILTYVGRNLVDNVVIEELITTHDAKNRDGFNFTLTLKQVRIADSVINSGGTPPVGPDPVTGGDAEHQTKSVQDLGIVRYTSKPCDEEVIKKIENTLGVEIGEVERDRIYYLPVEKEKIPCKFKTYIDYSPYEITIMYNAEGDFFTWNIKHPKVPGYSFYNGKIVYGLPVKLPKTRGSQYDNLGRSGRAVLWPIDITGKVTRVGYDNLGEEVLIYVIPESSVRGGFPW